MQKLKTLKTALRIEKQVEKLLEMSLLDIQTRIDEQHAFIGKLKSELEQALADNETAALRSLMVETQFHHQVSTQNEITAHYETIENLLAERQQVEQLKAKQSQKIEGLESLVERIEREKREAIDRELAIELMDSYLRKSCN